MAHEGYGSLGVKISNHSLYGPICERYAPPTHPKSTGNRDYTFAHVLALQDYGSTAGERLGQKVCFSVILVNTFHTCSRQHPCFRALSPREQSRFSPGRSKPLEAHTRPRQVRRGGLVKCERVKSSCSECSGHVFSTILLPWRVDCFQNIRGQMPYRRRAGRWNYNRARQTRR